MAGDYYDPLHDAEASWTPRDERECRYGCARMELIGEIVTWKIATMEAHGDLTRAIEIACESGGHATVVDALTAVHRELSRMLATDEHRTWCILNEPPPFARAEA